MYSPGINAYVGLAVYFKILQPSAGILQVYCKLSGKAERNFGQHQFVVFFSGHMPITGFLLEALGSTSTVSQHNTVTRVELLQLDTVNKVPLLHPAHQDLFFYTFLL
jgi:hypothetical protein